jgi:uncharacterized protein (TIGR02217 family)
MSFHEVRFPASLSFGSVGGPERRTEVVTLANGHEERNSPWLHSKRRYDAGLGMRSLDDVELLIAFFEARMGQMYGFRWKDWADYKSSIASADVSFEDQQIAVGDGVTSVFPLVKIYRSGGHTYTRPITKPMRGTVRVGVARDELQESIDYEFDATTGLVTFSHPPDPDMPITAGFEFDVPVRFDTDHIHTSVASFQAGEALNVPVLEVRL